MKDLTLGLVWEKIQIAVIAIVFSSVLFYSFFTYLNSLRYVDESSIKHEKKVDIDKDIMAYNELLGECLDKYNFDLDIDCDKKIREKIEKEQEPKEGTRFINSIYFLLVMALAVQTFLFFKTFSKDRELTQIHFHFSDWAINAPPILGVLGTIISFSLMVSNSKDGDIQDVFNLYFFDAAITTILGGFVYVLNMLLKSRIFLFIKDED